MADEINNAVAAAPENANAATQQPASPQTPVEITGGTPDAEAKEFEKAFGGKANPAWKDIVEIGAEDAGPAAPSEDGHAAPAAQPDASKPAAKGAPQTQADPAAIEDEVLKELDDLVKRPGSQTPPAADKTKTDDQVKLDDAALEKRINPDGKTPVDQQLLNAKKIAVEAQSLIGRQGNELKQARDLAAQIHRDFVIDPKTNQPRPLPDAAFRLMDQVPKEEVDRLLADRGYKIVPKDWNGPVSEAQSEDAMIEAIANELIPNKELSLDEKLQEINSNPRNQAKFNARIAKLKSDEQARVNNEALNRQTQTATQRIQREQELKQSESRVKEFFSKLKSLPYYEKELAPAIDYWNKQLGPVSDRNGNPLPGAIRGEARLQLVYRLAQLDRMPGEMRRVIAEARAAERKAVMEKWNISAPDGPGAPTFVPSRSDGGRKKGEGATPDVQKAFEKAFL